MRVEVPFDTSGRTLVGPLWSTYFGTGPKMGKHALGGIDPLFAAAQIMNSPLSCQSKIDFLVQVEII